MLSIEKIRRIDPKSTKNLTDEEIEAIRKSFYEFGQLIFDDWHLQKFGPKSPVGSLTNKLDENTI
jgi:hypothetical protein